MNLLREYISVLLKEKRYINMPDQDVPHGLSLPEITQYLSQHFGKAKITITDGPLDLGVIYDPTSGLANKPTGLWYGCGTSWLTWLEAQDSESMTNNSQIWSLKVDMSKVKSILTEKDLKQFTYENIDYENYPGRGIMIMDWNKASQKFSGVECCIYPVADMLKGIMSNIIWYQGIDIASGCVWDLSAITNSALVAELKDDGWEVYV